MEAEKKTQIPKNGTAISPVGERFAEMLDSISKKATALAQEFGSKTSTSTGSEISGKNFNEGLHFFNADLRLGIKLIYLDEDKKDGRRLLVISMPFAHGRLKYSDSLAELIVSQNKIEDVPVLLQGPWIDDLMGFKGPRANGIAALKREALPA